MALARLGVKVVSRIQSIPALTKAWAKNDIESVEAICFTGLAATPDDQLLLSVLADIYWRNGRFADALSMAQKALISCPENFEILRIAITACSELGRMEEAREFATQMVKALPLSGDPVVRALLWTLRPFDWVPRIKRFRMTAHKEQRVNTEWVEWARTFLSDGSDVA